MQQELGKSRGIERKWKSVYDSKHVYWTLCIRWSEGIAERVGLGFVFESALKYSHTLGPVWKEIVLG